MDPLTVVLVVLAAAIWSFIFWMDYKTRKLKRRLEESLIRLTVIHEHAEKLRNMMNGYVYCEHCVKFKGDGEECEAGKAALKGVPMKCSSFEFKSIED